MVIVVLIALLLVLIPTASTAVAKPIENTQFALQTSQAEAGTLFYFRRHETEGRRFLFARIPVRLTCDTGSTVEQTFTISGNLDKGDNDTRLRLTEAGVPLPGDASVKTMLVRLLPNPKKGSKRKRAVWKRARGFLTSDLTSTSVGGGASHCAAGPVRFDTAIVTRF